MPRPRPRNLRAPILAIATSISCAIFMAGCKGEESFAEAKAPPPSDPARLHSAMIKLEEAYQTCYGSKHDPALAPSDYQIAVAFSRHDVASALAVISKDRDMYRDAAAAAKAGLTYLSKNTALVGPADHDAYTDFYNAEADRLGSKAAEYTAFLALQPNPGNDRTNDLIDLVSRARVADALAQKLIAQ